LDIIRVTKREHRDLEISVIDNVPVWYPTFIEEGYGLFENATVCNPEAQMVKPDAIGVETVLPVGVLWRERNG
jgi:hypothetical protein